MLRFLEILLSAIEGVHNKLLRILGTLHFKIKLTAASKTVVGRNVACYGFAFIRLKQKSRITLGDHVKLNNTERFNSIGRQYKCVITVRGNAELIIGSNTGISSSSIFCTKKIKIGNNVKIGGNVCIYDTDFHSINYLTRRDSIKDKENVLSKEVEIGNDVFIGAHSTILKGVSIGDRSIIGAGSVVAKNIPADEIWAGNPVKFIRKLNV